MIGMNFEYVKIRITESEWLIDRTSIESEYDEESDIGIIGGSLMFKDGSIFHFKEVFLGDVRRYRFHYMNSGNNLILRWDNAPHHKNLKTFPHHVHLPDAVEEHEEIDFIEALNRIEEIVIRTLDAF